MRAKPARAGSAELEALPNIGKAITADLRAIGIRTPAQLKGKDPYALYATLNRVIGVRHDPCVLDTFIAAVRHVEGSPAVPWWTFSAERRKNMAAPAGRKRRPS